MPPPSPSFEPAMSLPHSKPPQKRWSLSKASSAADLGVLWQIFREDPCVLESNEEEQTSLEPNRKLPESGPGVWFVKASTEILDPSSHRSSEWNGRGDIRDEYGFESALARLEKLM
ncbi:predicted protein [Histoplasma capsulatum var. duboisii H88]|uniref:Predicted protein n=1 Tax=Ajellomyces capsulatus (strain H88) TaxID=544711 RepID=F0UC44_AJEC8|nr:predicted protein [Histoplasma capsulatum var. duboisii H88]